MLRAQVYTRQLLSRVKASQQTSAGWYLPNTHRFSHVEDMGETSSASPASGRGHCRICNDAVHGGLHWQVWPSNLDGWPGHGWAWYHHRLAQDFNPVGINPTYIPV